MKIFCFFAEKEFLNTISFKFNKTSKTSSLNPSTTENSCFKLLIRAPVIEEAVKSNVMFVESHFPK
jgi:hypothetical protein